MKGKDLFAKHVDVKGLQQKMKNDKILMKIIINPIFCEGKQLHR